MESTFRRQIIDPHLDKSKVEDGDADVGADALPPAVAGAQATEKYLPMGPAPAQGPLPARLGR